MSSKVGIVIDQYPSVAAVVKIMRKYTNDSMLDIRNHMSRNEFVLACDFVDTPEVRRIIKCYNELKKNKITAKIYEDYEEFQSYEEIDLQLLKNWVHSSREIERQIEAEVELEAGEVSASNLEEYNYLWGKDWDEWVVLKDEYDYTIFNIRTKSALQIEDIDLNNQVAAMMILQGNRVIEGKKAIENAIRADEG